MKKLGVLFSMIAVISMLLTSSCTTIDPGSVGIVVHNFGDNKGVSDVATTTGFTWFNPISTTIYQYPTNVQTAKWTKSVDEGNPINEEITFTNKDNMVISADVSISYSLTYEKVPYFYVKFRNDDINDFTHGFLRNVTRDAFNETGGSFSIDEIMGDNTKFILAVRKKIQSDIDSIGVNIEQFGVIGAPRPPQGVIDAINSKLEATQLAIKKENEVREAQAQASKDVAEAKGDSASTVIRAQGNALAYKLQQQSLTPLLVEKMRIDAWQYGGSKVPTTVLSANSQMIYSPK